MEIEEEESMTVESIPKKDIEELDEIDDNENIELDDINKIQVNKKPNIYTSGTFPIFDRSISPFERFS